MTEGFRAGMPGNTVLGTVLVSEAVVLGQGNRFYPGVVIECRGAGRIVLGDGNVFWPGTVILAEAGSIVIGDSNAFGPGGCTLALDAGGGEIAIGDGTRLREGVVLLRGCHVGHGGQVLGPVQATDCRLGSGAPHSDSDPAARGGVLKGVGRARGLVVGRGEVILGEGRFDQRDLVSQLVFHPPGF